MTMYVNSNGNLLSTQGYVIKAGNRGHLYGDGLFESIRVKYGEPINLDQHINRMLDGMQVLEMEIPNNFNEAFFEREIHALLTKNELSEGARVRISIDRQAGGLYLPIENSIEFLIETARLPTNEFILNDKGLIVDLYSEMKKPINIVANHKTKNALLYIMAKIRAAKKGFDDFLILNQRDEIIEGTSSNLFIVSNGVLYTAGLELGCLGGTMRMQVINLALANQIKVYECSITPQNLLAADEVFLTNAIQGILWVKKFRSKEYSNELAKEFTHLLNEKWR